MTSVVRKAVFIAAVLATGSVAVLAVMSPVAPEPWVPSEPRFPQGACQSAPGLSLKVLADNLPGTPDGLDFMRDGTLITALSTGEVIGINTQTGDWWTLARVDARLSGLAASATGEVYAVSEQTGSVYKATASDRMETALARVGGEPLHWSNDVTVAKDGAVFFTTTAANRELSQSYLEVLEHSGSGKLYRFDPFAGTGTLLRDELLMANGIAYDAVSDTLLVAETSEYRLSQLSRGGEIIQKLEGMPGFAGNIRASDRAGIFWLTLLSPRNPFYDNLAGLPTVRRLIAWAPRALLPGPKATNCLVEVNTNAPELDAALWQVTADFPFASFSTAIERAGVLYLSPAAIVPGSGGRIYSAEIPPR